MTPSQQVTDINSGSKLKAELIMFKLNLLYRFFSIS